ncbi:MAG TPA: ubiquinol-cytochrome c reductase iron-sulfur subunit [Anaerolineae bacterium]|jgi:cytochrome b6-f complex iron-sulfur subunit
MSASPVSKQTINRRQVFSAVWGLSLFALFGQFGSAVFQFLKPRIAEGGFGSKVTAGRAKEFKNGTVSYVQEGRFYVSRLDDGGFLAIWQRCTHLGCTVPYRKDVKQFMCPCHSSVFNTKGEVISGPAPRPMDIFPITIVDGQLIVDTSQAITREKFDTSQLTRA